jgi:hypothetical protein
LSVSHGSTSLSDLLLCQTRYDVVDSEEHAGRFNGSLVNLKFHCYRFPDICGSHVGDLTGVSINTDELVAFDVVLRAQFSDRSDDISSAVLSEGLGDGFESVCNWIEKKTKKCIGF